MVEAVMSSTTNFLSACSGTRLEYSEGPSEIRVCRDVLEMALDRFHDEVTEIRQRKQEVFESINDLLPQIFAAMVERELLSRSRMAVLSILEKLSELLFSSRPWYVFASHADVRSAKKLSDATLALWFAEELPRVLEQSKGLLEDYFDELLQCICDVESARSRLFSALDIAIAEPDGDLSWIREIRLDTSTVPLFTWLVPAPWRYLSAIPSFRGFVIRRCERNISAKVATYCDQLTSMARRTSREWVSDVQWQLDQDLSERTDSWVISAEISKQIRTRWRALLFPSQRKTTPRVPSSYQRAASIAG
jgi:hypothetical protein